MTNKPTQQLIQLVRSGVIHIEFLDIDNSVIGSGSAFLAHGYLITNNHVYTCTEKSSLVKLSWQTDQTSQSLTELSLSTTNFQSYFQVGSDKNNHDYAIEYVQEEIDSLNRE